MHALLAPVSPAESGTEGPQPINQNLDTERRVEMAARRAAQFTALAEAHNVGAETVGQLRDDITALARSYVEQPPMAVLADLIQAQDSAFRLLEGKQKPALTRDLYQLAALASCVIAKVSHDMGRPRDAMTQARTAYACAENADDGSLMSWARGLQSLISYWSGRHEDARHYAQLGSATGRSAGTVAPWLASLEARAWAMLGFVDQTKRAVQEGWDLRERCVQDGLDAIGGLFAFSVAKQHYYAAGAYGPLPDANADAQRESIEALAKFAADDSDQRWFSDRAGARSELALARVRAGEIDGARNAMDPVLGLPSNLRIAGIVESAARVHRALGDRQYVLSPQVRSFREELEAFRRIGSGDAT